MSDSFSVLKRHLKVVFGVLFASSFAFTLLTFWLPRFQSGDSSRQSAFLNQQAPYEILQSFWGTGFNDISRWMFMTIVVIVTTMGYRILEKEMPSGMKSNSWLNTVIRFFVLYVPLPGLMLIIMTENGFRAWLYGIFIIPMLIHLMAGIWYGSNNVFVNLRQLIPEKHSIANTLRISPSIIASAGILLYTSFVGVYRLFIWNNERVKNYLANHTGFLIVNFLVLLLFFLNSEIWLIFIQFFSWIVPPDEGYLAAFYAVINFFTISTAFFACWLLGTISGALFYFSNIEKTEAPHLHAQIDQVGTARQIRGLPKE